MRVTVELRDDEIDQIKRCTGLDSDSAAVAHAAREYLRVAQLKELRTELVVAAAAQRLQAFVEVSSQ